MGTYKISLSPYDVKRYVKDNRRDKLAYGHFSVRKCSYNDDDDNDGCDGGARKRICLEYP